MKNFDVKDKWTQYIQELHDYYVQGENLDLDSFEEWKQKMIKELDGNNKIKFSKMKFYSIYEVFSESDDLPF